MQLKISNYKMLGLVILVFVLILSFGTNIFLIKKAMQKEKAPNNPNLSIKPVSAQEIYPLFFCPCCGQPLDKNNICCGAMEERINYIDSLVAKNLSEKEIILNYVKKYGLNSFVDPTKQKEIKEELVKIAPTDRPIIFITPETYDFGDVSQKAGKIYTYFDLKNEGKSDLVIDRMDTSCGCTFVSLVFQDKESPLFAMPGHGYENPEWEGVLIPPGETAQLKVMYDPDVHQDFRGFAIREIYIYSNDPIDFEKKVQIELNQID